MSEDVDKFLNKKSALQADVAHTVNADDPPDVKLRKIYARVQKIRNLSIEDAKSEKEEKHEQLKPNNNVEDVLKHNYGSGDELNSHFWAWRARRVFRPPRYSSRRATPFSFFPK